MKRCVLIPEDDYKAILSLVHDTRIDAGHLGNSYLKEKIQDHLDAITLMLETEDK